MGLKTLLIAGALGLAAGGVLERTERELLEKRAKVDSLMERKRAFWRDNKHIFKRQASIRNAPQTCTGGSVTLAGEVYSCENVDFLSYVGMPELEIFRPNFQDGEYYGAADIWGWKSDLSQREITLICTTNGLRFIDSTDPINPLNLGYMASNRDEDVWCDVKVYKNTAYVVKDNRAGVQQFRGIQVFNLTRLESNDGSGVPLEYQPDFVYKGHGNSHNVIIDVDSGFLYSVGTGGDNCNTGLHVVDLADPLKPVFAGCAGQDGYVHDAQCLIYSGPDVRYKGKQLCFGFAVDALTIFNVENKAQITIVSRTPYNGSQYTHQGWLNAEQDIVFLDDELDEEDGGLTHTRTYIFDVSNLENPVRRGQYDHPTVAIDHNLYIWAQVHKHGWTGSAPVTGMSDLYMYNANYASGLRVVDIQGMKNTPPTLKEVGHFDVSPDIEEITFAGSWSTYMHASGVMAISCIERGLYLVQPRMVFTDPPKTSSPVPVPTAPPVPAPTTPPVAAPVGSPVAPPTTSAFPGIPNPSGLGDDSKVLILSVFAIFAILALVLVGGLVAFMLPKKGAAPVVQKEVAPRQSVEVKQAVEANRKSSKVATTAATNPLFSEDV